ncbi:MBL fold metallo-hydrolase [Undibacterium sp.]|uniref:MBL fold metallo-hydrolase n=1 Tax=Undibacterium sp. TaxID=1914977 RepID=UPI002CB22E7E|nr:MBL fold metallo-hydrolase [Undibacterium sp.]HTD05277.1 MBL fold metallo-hydrolase [Undibacterium sp.]
MKITQLRNATLILHIGNYHILVDPMLSDKNALPALLWLDGQRVRNPIVDLPEDAEAALESVTHCLLTHCQRGHFDHLDRAGKRFLRDRQIPVICTPHDAAYLQKLGLNTQPLAKDHRQPQPLFGGVIRTVRCTHGRGMIGLVMEHGVGYFLEIPGEPSLYLAGDSILSDEVRDFVTLHQPGICVIPAGGARLDAGQELIMGLEEALEFVQLSKGIVIANHLEAVSHCPVQRSELTAAARDRQLDARLRIPEDGATLEFQI